MKKILPVIVLSFFIILGISFLIMVLKMVWFPPDSMGMMGMMMGRRMLFSHIIFKFAQIMGVLMIITGLLIFLWMIKRRNKK